MRTRGQRTGTEVAAYFQRSVQGGPRTIRNILPTFAKNDRVCIPTRDRHNAAPSCLLHDRQERSFLLSASQLGKDAMRSSFVSSALDRVVFELYDSGPIDERREPRSPPSPPVINAEVFSRRASTRRSRDSLGPRWLTGGQCSPKSVARPSSFSHPLFVLGATSRDLDAAIGSSSAEKNLSSTTTFARGRSSPSSTTSCCSTGRSNEPPASTGCAEIESRSRGFGDRGDDFGDREEEDSARE